MNAVNGLKTTQTKGHERHVCFVPSSVQYSAWQCCSCPPVRWVSVASADFLTALPLRGGHHASVIAAA